MAQKYTLLWGHPVPYSVTVQKAETGRSFGKIPKAILDQVESDLAERGMAIERTEGAYVFYNLVEHARSILPIDVGFDLRLQKMYVNIDETMAREGVVYEDRQKRTRSVQGSTEKVAAALRKAGFKVKIEP